MKSKLWLTLSLVCSLGTVPLLSVNAAPAPDMHVAKYKDNSTPYPLYAAEFGTDPLWTAAELELLGKNFDGIFGNPNISMSMANTLRSHYAPFKINQYNGKWAVNGTTADYIENNKKEVLYYRVGNSSASITATQTTFSLNDVFGSLIPSTSNTWNSNFDSNGEFKFVTWLLIGDELMKIQSVSGNTVTVIRGIHSTVPKSYPAGTPILSPVYGAAPVAGMTSEVQYRLDEGTNVRWDLLLSAALAEYDKNRGGIWIDILIGNLSQFAQSGQTVPSNRIWDIRNQSVYNDEVRAENVERGIVRIQEQFKAQKGVYPVIWGNNLLHPTTLTDQRVKMLLSTSIKPRPIDGFAMENSYGGYGTGGNSGTEFWFKDYTGWKNNLKSIMFMGENKLAALPLMLDGGQDNKTFAALPAAERRRILLYGYASYLLGVKVEPDNKIYTKIGFTPLVNPGTGPAYLYLEPMFTWDIGKPTQTLSSSNYSNYKLSGREVWVRTFQNGIVIVNPSENAENNVSVSSYGSLRDPEQGNISVTSVSLPSKTAKILLFN
ncbi:hypothetical protein JJQ72_14835 [Paenibacillus sp. F411]|uniref:hypothetical protein n=1 Tax=Paenibacillus sp. F411 TaxID=2820239 RepID=UPI001AAF8CD0|nr:hypothetical protein [Paenibacillus sp. F411]MBO2945252.1 hypothetical protein [Paenibacillus sp. F411]